MTDRERACKWLASHYGFFAVQDDKKGNSLGDLLASVRAEGAAEERERSERLSLDVYGDRVAAVRTDDPRTVGEKISAAIRALPKETPP